LEHFVELVRKLGMGPEYFDVLRLKKRLLK